MLARELALRGDQSDHILQLIAEAVRAAGLVERRPRPQPTRQRLIGQPAIEHDVHRPLGRAHLDRALSIVPEPGDGAQRRRVVGRSTATNEL